MKYRREENGHGENESVYERLKDRKRGRESDRERESEWKRVKERKYVREHERTRSLIYIHNTKYKLYKYINKFNVIL